MIEPTRIEVRAGEALILTWPDERVDEVAAWDLRDACMCAGCKNLPGGLPPADPETCRILQVGLVGAYAINVVFAPDGHGTGIYPFDRLRDLGNP